MRHNRRAVMTERYKLYMRKNIFNGRYFVRNMQIALCAVVLVALVVGGIVLAHSGSDNQKELAKNDKVSAMDALFGSSEEATKATTEEVTEVTTEAVQAAMATEEVTTEATTEPVVAYTEQTVASKPEGEFDKKCIANVEETLNIRKTPSTDGEFVGSMNPGAIAIVEGTDGEWTKIKSGDVEGYVLSEYVLTGDSAEEFAKDYVTLQGTVLEDGVNIREEKSTDADIVTVLDKDASVTVLDDPRENDKKDDTTEEASTETATSENTEAVTSEAATETATQAAGNDTTEITASTEQNTEVTTQNSSEEVTTEQNTEASTQTATTEQSTDDITWLTVMLADGKTGYVSADYVDIDRLYEIAVSAEELQRREEEKLAAEKAAAEAAAEAERQATQVAQNTTTTTSSNTSSDTSYKGASTTPIKATESGECIGTFTVTAYCGCKKCSGGNNKTASGTTPTEGRTIAADTSVLPYGSQVVIDGVVYTVEDCGSGVNGNHIDIFFSTHAKALAYGTKTVKVYKY